jgi:hypothetical protein
MIDPIFNNIVETIKRDFPKHTEKYIFELLDEYKNNTVAIDDRVRVYWSILNLSSGDVNKLKEYVKEANINPNFIIMFGE